MSPIGSNLAMRQHRQHVLARMSHAVDAPSVALQETSPTGWRWRHASTWTTSRCAPTVAIHVAVMARPDFAEVFTIVAVILDGLYGPGTAARVERGLGAWEDMYAAGASEAVAAWIADEKATVTAAGEVVDPEG